MAQRERWIYPTWRVAAYLRPKDRAFFEAVHLSEGGAIAWSEDIELCPDALYMQLTGKSVEELMPRAKAMAADA